MNVEGTPHFQRQYKKQLRKNQQIRAQLERAISALIQGERPPALKIHKLTGNLDGFWAFSLGSDLRVVFKYTESGILMHGIGSHDEIYG